MVSFKIFGKGKASSDSGRLPYALSFEWIPYKLFYGRKSSTTLFLRVKNIGSEDYLTSLEIELPDKLGFDAMSLSKKKQIKLGVLKQQEEREQRIEVNNSINAEKGEYTVTIRATAHYGDYEHVINSITKRTTISVV